MTELWILGAGALTSCSAFLIGTKTLHLPARRLSLASGKMLESLGMGLVFLFVNLSLAMGAVLVIRALTGRFLSLYVAGDVVWLGVSLVQGLVFQWWREQPTT